MSEIKVGENESLESALKDSKESVQELGFYLRLKRENITLNQVLKERKNLKLARKRKFK